MIITFLTVIIIDQVSKFIVQQSMTLYTSIPVLGDFIKLTYIHNPGGAFGIMPGNRTVFLVLSLIACGVMIYYLYIMPASERQGRLALMGSVMSMVSNVLSGVTAGISR